MGNGITRRDFLRNSLVGGVAVGTGLGSVGLVHGQAKKEPIKIGILVEKTGGLAAYGYSHERVMVAAVDKVNKEGGIAGRPVELYVEDSESKPSVGDPQIQETGGDQRG